MRIGNLDHLMIKLDAELFDDARYIDIRDQISNIIDNAPTIDISGLPKIHYDRGFIAGYDKARIERTQGEWILKETDYDDGGNNFYECSNCHYSDIHSESADVPFCWHCGAYMGGDENNGK